MIFNELPRCFSFERFESFGKIICHHAYCAPKLDQIWLKMGNFFQIKQNYFLDNWLLVPRHCHPGGDPALNSYATHTFTLTNAKRLQKRGQYNEARDNKVRNMRDNRGKISLFVIPSATVITTHRRRSSSLIPENYNTKLRSKYQYDII
jgi:hypothetical protein